MAVARGRSVEVETLRALACVALVFLHAVGTTDDSGLNLPMDHPFHTANTVFRDIRMPLFSFISGFVFVCTVNDISHLGALITKKARRLLVPMVPAALLSWIALSMHHGIGSQPEIFDIFYLPYKQFWLVYAVFIIMVFFYSASLVLRYNKTYIAFAFFILTTIIYIFFQRWNPNLFSSWGAIYLGPYFMAGFILANAHTAISARRLLGVGWRRGLAVLLFGALLLLEYLLVTGVYEVSWPQRKAIGVAAGVTGCFLLFCIAPRIPAIAWIGGYSFTIFLYHYFFTTGARVALHMAAPGVSEWIAAPFCLLVGLLAPIAMHETLLATRPTALVFLGIQMPEPGGIVRAAAQRLLRVGATPRA